MKTKIILQRHAESVANTLHIYAGHSDYELSALGHRQAKCAADALASERVDKIYSSDLSRTKQTAEPHAALRGIEIAFKSELREMFLGEWDGMEVNHLRESYPYEAVYLWNNFFGLVRAPGGESAPSAAERFFAEVKKIAEENCGKTVLIVAHAAVIRLFWGKMLGFGPEEIGRNVPFPANASFSTLEYGDGDFTPIEYSNAEHLKTLASELLN